MTNTYNALLHAATNAINFDIHYSIQTMKHTFTLIACALIGCSALAQTAYINGTPIAVVNSSTKEITSTVSLPGYSPNIVSNSNGATMVVTTFFNTYEIDVATGNVVDSIIGYTANHAYGNSATEMFGVSGTQFYQLDLSTNTLDSITLPKAERIQRRPGTDEFWVTADSSIHVVDVSSGMVLANTMVISDNPYDGSEVRFSEDGSTAIKMNWNSKSMTKIDPDTKTALATADLTFAPNLSGIEVTADGDWAYASSPGNNKLYKVQTSDMTVTDSTELPNPPFGMYRHPMDGMLWVVGHFDHIVYIVDPSDLSLLDSIIVQGDPHIVAFTNTPLGVEQEQPARAESLDVYPNPFANTIHVDRAVPGQPWTLTDLTGRTVDAGVFRTATERITWNGLTPGVYVLSSGEQCIKLTKQ